MKLATIAVETPVGPRRRLCVRDDEAGDRAPLVDVNAAYAAALVAAGEADPGAIADAHAPSEIVDFLERGERAMAAAREALAHARETDAEFGPTGGRLRFDPDSEEVALLAPIPRPNSFRDCMVFEEHARGASDEAPPEVWYDQPVYYKGNPDTIVGPGETVHWPDYSDIMDYELELAFVVGKRGIDLDADEAGAHVAGYTILNDFSARDAQGAEMEAGLGPAKGKDFASALGPYLVTPDEFDVESARMTAEINGEQWSDGLAGDMYHSVGDILAHISQSEPLLPGDVIGSGTVGGGCGLELDRFLSSGDTVTLSIDGIGVLTNTVE